MMMTKGTSPRTTIPVAKLLILQNPVNQVVIQTAKETAKGGRDDGGVVDVADEVTMKAARTTVVVIEAANEVLGVAVVVAGEVVEAVAAAETTTVAADLTDGVAAETSDLVEFAVLLPVRKSSKEPSKAFSNFTPNSTASCGIRIRTISLRNPIRSSPARLSKKPGCVKAC